MRWRETAAFKGADARPNTSDGGPRSGPLQERSAQGNNQTPEAGDWIARGDWIGGANRKRPPHKDLGGGRTGIKPEEERVGK